MSSVSVSSSWKAAILYMYLYIHMLYSIFIHSYDLFYFCTLCMMNNIDDGEAHYGIGMKLPGGTLQDPENSWFGELF